MLYYGVRILCWPHVYDLQRTLEFPFLLSSSLFLSFSPIMFLSFSFLLCLYCPLMYICCSFNGNSICVCVFPPLQHYNHVFVTCRGSWSSFSSSFFPFLVLLFYKVPFLAFFYLLEDCFCIFF